MRICVVGTSHSRAPLALLERLSVSPGHLEQSLEQVRGMVAEAFLLSTCNRTEIYAVTDDTSRDAAALRGYLAARIGVAPELLAPYCYEYEDDAAVGHALRVASGLESMVLGEDQIQAQMKRALAAARGAEMLGATLDRLGAAALGCGKRVRALTGIGQHAVSLESLAVDAARTHLGALHGEHIVVLGSGSSAGIVVRQLTGTGAQVTVVGRTHGSASALALETQARCEEWHRLPDVLASARAVFCCTSAPHPVLSTDTLSRRIATRGDAALLCVDLGMPRDIDEAVHALPGVSVIALSQLARQADAHRQARQQHVPAAETIVARETDRYLAWLRSRSVAGEIAARRARAEGIADAELKRALARLRTSCAHDRAVVSEMARRIARKLMHEDTHALTVETRDMNDEREIAVS